MLLCSPVDIADGVGIVGAVEPGEVVHAETAAETRTAKVTQLTAVSLALAAAAAVAGVPGVLLRAFMKPPYMPGGRPI